MPLQRKPAEDKAPVAEAQERSAGAVVFVKEKPEVKFLLLHYTGGHWSFPKGNIEKGETELVTAQREIQEETGLTDLQFFDGFREVIHYYYKRGGSTILKEVIFLLAQSFKEHVTISHEHIGFAWLTYDKALEKVTYDNDKNILKKATDYIKRHGD
ncbi:NUDIX domain-containing protein [Candidatus Woesearchaeota archaeon]|nr:NUDIX domain-containing protein [Candidatus Woesearchaeota archaeon]